MSQEPRPERPSLRITGGATPEEVAAVVAVLAAAQGAHDGMRSRRRSLWNSRARAARPRLSPGPGAWRGSALPR